MQKTTFVVSCQWDELHFYDQSSPSHSQKLSIIVFCQHQDMSADPSQKTTMFYLWHIRKFKDGNPLAFWSFSCKFKISLLSACKKSLREFWFWVSSVVFKDAHLRRFWWHNLKKISVHYLRWSRSWDIQKMKQKFSCSWMPWSRHLRLNIDKAAFWTWKQGDFNFEWWISKSKGIIAHKIKSLRPSHRNIWWAFGAFKFKDIFMDIWRHNWRLQHVLTVGSMPSKDMSWWTCQGQLTQSPNESRFLKWYLLPCKKTYPVKNVSHVLSTSKSTCNSHNRPITMRRPINIITPWWKQQTLFRPSRLWSEMYPTITIILSCYFRPVESICK
jgi:hypothetical protein